jgi:hypothetical protein
MHNAADDPTIVRPLDAPNIRRQARFDPLPLLIAQPKQVSAHDPNPLPKTNQDRIVRAEKLMSSDPSRWESPLGSGACYLTGQQIPCASAAPRGGLEMIEVSRYILALIVALTHLQPLGMGRPGSIAVFAFYTLSGYLMTRVPQ